MIFQPCAFLAMVTTEFGQRDLWALGLHAPEMSVAGHQRRLRGLIGISALRMFPQVPS
jgi:hypothetical protein